MIYNDITTIATNAPVDLDGDGVKSFNWTGVPRTDARMVYVYTYAVDAYLSIYRRKGFKAHIVSSFS